MTSLFSSASGRVCLPSQPAGRGPAVGEGTRRLHCAAPGGAAVILAGVLILLTLIGAAPMAEAAPAGLTIRIGLTWDRWAAECTGVPGLAQSGADFPQSAWPGDGGVSETQASLGSYAVAGAYRVAQAAEVTGLAATDSRWLAAAARQAAQPQNSAAAPAVDAGIRVDTAKTAGVWYCILRPRTGSDHASSGDLSDSARALGWPVFATSWPTLGAGHYAAVPLTGAIRGLVIPVRSPLFFTASSEANPVAHGGRTYRGTLRVAAAGDAGLLAVVNILDIEEYLLGVVPSEMPASWPLEALKAQAVAARTYAVANLGKHSARGFDLCHDVHCQAYLGLGNEYPGPTAAVRGTSGIVVTYGGRLINAVYHAHSGGATDSSAAIWGGATPYLLGTSRTYEQPYYWTATNSRLEVQAIVASALGGDVPEGLFPLLGIEPTSYTAGGRATRANLTGPATEAQITVSRLRSGLGTYRLRDAKFGAYGIWVAGLWGDPAGAAAFGSTLPVIAWMPGARGEGVFLQAQSVGEAGAAGVGLGITDLSYYVFSGQGFGHGVGMSQWGAREMAALGKTYREILGNFYGGIALTANYGR